MIIQTDCLSFPDIILRGNRVLAIPFFVFWHFNCIAVATIADRGTVGISFIQLLYGHCGRKKVVVFLTE